MPKTFQNNPITQSTIHKLKMLAQGLISLADVNLRPNLCTVPSVGHQAKNKREKIVPNVLLLNSSYHLFK